MNLSFLVNDPRPANQHGNEPLVIQEHILNSVIHRVYVDRGNSADIIYEHCFVQFPEEWRTNVCLTSGRLTRFIGHSICPIRTIQLPLYLYDRIKKPY